MAGLRLWVLGAPGRLYLSTCKVAPNEGCEPNTLQYEVFLEVAGVCIKGLGSVNAKFMAQKAFMASLARTRLHVN